MNFSGTGNNQTRNTLVLQCKPMVGSTTTRENSTVVGIRALQRGSKRSLLGRSCATKEVDRKIKA